MAALEKKYIWNIFISTPINMATKIIKQRKTEDKNLAPNFLKRLL